MLERIKFYLTIYTIIILLLPSAVLSQIPGPIIIGNRVKFHSTILNEDRSLLIYTPESRSPGDHFPVLYLLDGESFFIPTVGVVQFLADAGRIPSMIIVGIENTNRVRDLTPPPSDTSFPGSGGADIFLRVIKDEVIPYIDSHYRTAPFRVIAGHSLGGSFVLNAFLSQTKLFNSYFILSPNLWWGNDILVNRLESFLKNTQKLTAIVYETHTTLESPQNIAETSKLRKLIENYKVDSLDWKLMYMPNETHQSIFLKSIYDALSYLFYPWESRANLSKIGMTGLQLHYKELSKRYGYPIKPDEEIVNSLGYIELSRNNLDKAIKIFNWNVQLYPKSSNVYDSLGEAYLKQGNKKLALENYEKSIKLNPDNSNAIEIVKRLKSN